LRLKNDALGGARQSVLNALRYDLIRPEASARLGGGRVGIVYVANLRATAVVIYGSLRIQTALAILI